jgi:putative ABC transport system permease protein
VAIVLIGDRVRVALQTYDGRQDIDVLSIPWRQLVVFVVLAAIVGVLAAVLPARRAAKLDVLRAIRAE